jgi:hypothetical protein
MLDPKQRQILVVIEIEERDAYYAHQAVPKPIAAFICHASASDFVALKQREGFVRINWDIITIPLYAD